MVSSWRALFLGIMIIGLVKSSNSQENLPYSRIKISGAYSCHNYGFDMLIQKQSEGYMFIDKTENKTKQFSKMLEPFELVLVNQFLDKVKMYKRTCPEEEIHGGSFHSIELDKKEIRLNNCSIDSLGTLNLRRLLRPDIFNDYQSIEEEQSWRIKNIIRDSIEREFEGRWRVNKSFTYEVGEVLALARLSNNDTISDGVWEFRKGGLKPFGNDSLNRTISLFERDGKPPVADYEKWFLGIQLISLDHYSIILNRHDAINFGDEGFENVAKQGIIRLEFREIYNSEDIKLLELVFVE